MVRTRFYAYSVLLISFIFFYSSLSIHAQTGRSYSIDADESSSLSLNAVAGTAALQATPGEGQVPQPGQPGSPFSVDHFWKRLGLELSGGYSPSVNRGAGYYGQGFTATVGVIDRVSPHWDLLLEGQILGQHGKVIADTNGFVGTASYGVAFHLDPRYVLRPGAATSPYVIGGRGFYHLGTHSACDSSNVVLHCDANSSNPFQTDLISENAFGFNAGTGIRHKILTGKDTEVFAEARYHFIASGSSALGQVSFLPINAGIRW